MEEHIVDLTNYINQLQDFKFLNVSDSYILTAGDVVTLSQDSSRNLTYNNMGATLIDGILQAGLNYQFVVKPRVDNFKRDYAYIKTTSDFHNLIQTSDLSHIINMNGQKLDRINQLVNLLLKYKIETEDEFYNWLLKSENIIILSNVKGIKEKTIDYLKILVGFKNTVAIDVRIKAFIKLACTNLNEPTYEYAHLLLMKTAERLNLTPANLDNSIWNYMSKKEKDITQCNNESQNKAIKFYGAYSDEQLKKLLAIEMTSKTNQSITGEALFSELKRRNPQIEVCDYNDVDAVIKYLQN